MLQQWLAGNGPALARFLAAVILGYLLGAIPVGYLVGRAYGVDVRQYASGRTGGTNVWRATGKLAPALITAFGDILKGGLAVLLGRYVLGSELAVAVAGAAAVAGHNWSVFLNFRGGAGGVPAGSALSVVDPIAGIFVVPAAVLAMRLSRYASVGTLTIGIGGAVALAAIAALAPTPDHLAHLLYGLLAGVEIALALRPNIKRLAAGTERRISG